MRVLVLILLTGCGVDPAVATVWEALGATGSPPAVKYVTDPPAPRVACQYYQDADVMVVMRTPLPSDGSLPHEALHGWQWRREWEDRAHASDEWQILEPKARQALIDVGR